MVGRGEQIGLARAGSALTQVPCFRPLFRPCVASATPPPVAWGQLFRLPVMHRLGQAHAAAPRGASPRPGRIRFRFPYTLYAMGGPFVSQNILESCVAPARAAPHRTAPGRAAPRRTAPHRIRKRKAHGALRYVGRYRRGPGTSASCAGSPHLSPLAALEWP